MKRIFLFIILSLFLFYVPGTAGEVQKIEVTSKVANIRSSPALDGEIAGKAYLGDVFIVIGVEGSWYKIELPSDKDGEKKIGYIYKAITKIPVIKKGTTEPPPTPTAEKEKKEIENEQKVVEEENKKAEKEKEKAEKEKLKEEKKAEKEKEKAIKKAEREKRKAERKAEREKKKAEKERIKAENKKSDVKVFKKKKETQDILFKGFFLKAGYMTEPKVDSLGDKWVADLGFDSPIGKYATWGLEFQPYFRYDSLDFVDLTSYNLVSNFFLNIKGGINLGKLWNKLKFMTVFLGGGPGVSLSYFYVDYQGNTGSDFGVHFAWHLVYGAEISLGKMKIIAEFQNNNIIISDIDPSTQKYKYFLVGLRF